MTTTYRAVPVTQRDGSAFSNSNCRMAAVATGIDFHTLGATVSSGADMRQRQSDQSGGTDSGDAAEAWRTYGQELRICDGKTFDDVLADLAAGRCVQLDVWHATAGGPCMSGSGQYGHSIAVAPERSGTRWLTSDPWCMPPKWVWWDEALLRAGAEALGGMAYHEATVGGAPTDERVLIARMRLALRRLMTAYRPGMPAPVTPPDTGGSGGRVFYTTTRTHDDGKGSDMPINASTGLITGLRAAVPKGLDFYADPNLVQRLGAMSADADVVYVGNPIGETVDGGSRAIQVNTSTAYNDGSVRPTIVYVAAAAIDPYSVPLPGDSTADVDAAIEARDAEWETWVLSGSPGSEE